MYRGAGIAAAAATLTLALTGPAWAYPQPSGLADGHDYGTVCPPRPADYSGTDAVVAELVAARQGQADACVRGEQLAAAEAAAATARATTAHADAAAVLAGPLPVNVENFPAAPATTAATVTYSDATATQVDNEARTLHGDLWILAGVVAGVFVAQEVLRRVWP